MLLVCVDDHSRFCSSYLDKQKSEVTKILKNFTFLVNRQFETVLHGLRMDDAKDFCNIELRKFFEGEGIRHDTSCLYTPEENELAERKICDIMDKGWTLIMQAHFPKNLLGLQYI